MLDEKERKDGVMIRPTTPEDTPALLSLTEGTGVRQILQPMWHGSQNQGQ